MKYMYPFYWVIAIFHVSIGTIRGVGKTLAAMVMSVASLCAARVAWIWITFQFVHKLNILLLGYPITWAIGAAMVFLYMKKSNWLKKPESAE